MKKTIEEHTFSFESPLVGSDILKREEKPERRKSLWDKLSDMGYKSHSIIIDQEEGWIYERKRNNQKGDKICKLYERLDKGWGDDGIQFWRPKLKDIVTCEAKRWKARLHYFKQMKLITPAFDLVLDNVPFCCIRKTDKWPGHAWIEFPKHEAYPGESPGVSWEWWDKKGERPENPLKQDIGDAWFDYEVRSRELRKRLELFESNFR